MNIRVYEKYIYFTLISLLYFLWVLWMESWWFLPGLLIIFDCFFTKKIFNFIPLARKHPKSGYKKTLYDFFVSVIIAFIIALFIKIFFFEAFKIPTSSMEKTLLSGDYILVNKTRYGPRMPITPLSIPFTHNKLPKSNVNSYLPWIKLPYKRLSGTNTVSRRDVVVFNYPFANYNKIKFNASSCKIKTPIDKKDIYVKRCVGMPGDTIEIKHNTLYINKKKEPPRDTYQYNYFVYTKKKLNPGDITSIDISNNDIIDAKISDYEYIIPLTKTAARQLKDINYVTSVKILEQKQTAPSRKEYFPHHTAYKWNRDNYGPLVIPGKNDTVPLTPETLPLYEQIIKIYENNSLHISDSSIYLNGKKTKYYVFKMDYYWMMGDNRHQSIDSRYWGFVPEDHIIGKAGMIWLSLSSKRYFPFNIRLKRSMKTIK